MNGARNRVFEWLEEVGGECERGGKGGGTWGYGGDQGMGYRE